MSFEICEVRDFNCTFSSLLLVHVVLVVAGVILVVDFVHCLLGQLGGNLGENVAPFLYVLWPARRDPVEPLQVDQTNEEFGLESRGDKEFHCSLVFLFGEA